MKNYMNVRASAVAHADLTSGRAPTIHAFKAGSTVTACGALSGHEVEAAHDKPVSCDACMKALMNQQRASDHRMPLVPGPQPVLHHNFSTHKSAWRKAIEHLSQRRDLDADERAYWQHELAAFDLAYRKFDHSLATGADDMPDVIHHGGPVPYFDPQAKAFTAMLDSGDADLLDKLRRMCGYVEDVSQQSVTIAQDDATREWSLYVGIENAILKTKRRSYHSTSFHQVIRVAAEKELAGLCDDEGCPHHGTTHVCINGDDIGAALAAFTTPTHEKGNTMSTEQMIEQYRLQLDGLIHLAQQHLTQIAQGTFNPTEAMPISALSAPVHVAGNTLVKACYEAAFKSGWWIDTETGEDVRAWPEKYMKLWVAAKLALVHSEVSEGLEGHRKGLKDDKLPHRDMLEVELADAVIRICDLAGGLGMDLGGAIAEKLEFNANRADHKIENRVAAGGKSI